MKKTAYEIMCEARDGDRLNDYIQWFIETYRPREDLTHSELEENRYDRKYRFDGDFHQLTRLIFQEAQRPFIRELSVRRDADLFGLSTLSKALNK